MSPSTMVEILTGEGKTCHAGEGRHLSSRCKAKENPDSGLRRNDDKESQLLAAQ